jgi:ribosome-associated translation inhibitor RaiA
MNIQINTGHNIEGNEALISKFSDIIESSLSRVSNHITTVEVHLKDEDGNKDGKNDKRCMIEVHIEGRKPIAVSGNADTLNQALDGAIDKLLRMVDGIIGRELDKRNDSIDPPIQEQELTEL